MPALQKFNIFVEDFTNKVHGLFGVGDLLKIALSNILPVATNSVFADITEIAAGNGYTAGGDDVQNSGARAVAIFTLTGTKVVWTASGGTIGPFQFVVLYNDTPVSPLNPLIAFWNHGIAITLQIGETFTVKFNDGDPTGDIFTLA